MCLGELSSPRCPRNDLAHLSRSDFVLAEPDKFARAALIFADAKAHGLGAHCDPRMNIFGRIPAPEEIQADADGFFSDDTINAGFCRQLPHQFVHIAPPSTGSYRVSLP